MERHDVKGGTSGTKQAAEFSSTGIVNEKGNVPHVPDL